jgi:hypothetical protein
MQRLFAVLTAFAVVAGAVLIGATNGSGELAHVERQVIEAARAPFRAFARRDARALCRSFTPMAARALIPHSPNGGDCISQVNVLMAKSQSFIDEPVEIRTGELFVTEVHVRRARATVVVSGSKHRERRTLALVRLGAKWQVASTPILAMIRACVSHVKERQCRNGIGNTLVFGFVENEGPMAIPPPAAVRRAGKQEVREFNDGAMVAVESGCLACHRIGDQGNKRPGPSLTHVGSRATKAQIEEAIVSPLEPMPSFKRLPKKKFHALVRFLQLLR